MDYLQILTSPLVLPGVAGLAILMLFLGFSRAQTAGTERIGKRLDRYAVREESAQTRGGERRRSAMDGLEQALVERGFGANLRTNLARADLKLRTTEFLLLNVAAVLIVFYLARWVFDSLLLGLVFGVLGFFVPHIYVGVRQRRRLQQFNDQLCDTINLLANSLRSGFSIIQSMETVAQQLPDPIAAEFHRVTQEIGLGLHYEQALNNMLRRVPSDDLDLMITAINIQARIGGNLAEILDTIGHTIRERVRIQGEIRVLTAQQMISGYILTGLPVILGLFLYFLNKEYIGRLFAEPCGWVMVGTSVVMIGAGFVIIRRIINIEV